jgi:hypothetical protein
MRRPLLLLAALALATPAGCAPEPAALPPAFAAGTTPNDVALSRCGQATVALVADSGEARLHAIDVADGRVVATTHFAEEQGPGGARFASPWAVAVTPDGARAAVTLFGQDKIAWVDPCAGVVLDVAGLEGAVTPEPVVLAAGRVLVAWPNIRAFGLGGDPPVLGAGVVAAYSVSGDVLTLEGAVELSCKNPQGLAVVPAAGGTADAGDVLVACSGPLARGPDGGQAAIEDGALVRLDARTLEVKHTVAAGRRAPGTPAVVGGRLVVGSLVDPLLCSAPLGAPALEDCIRLPGADVEAIFEVVRWDEETALAAQFTRDALLVIEVPGTALRVRDAIAVGPGGAAFRGALALDARRGFGRIDAVALLGLSAEIVPLGLQEQLP